MYIPNGTFEVTHTKGPLLPCALRVLEEGLLLLVIGPFKSWTVVLLLSGWTRRGPGWVIMRIRNLTSLPLLTRRRIGTLSLSLSLSLPRGHCRWSIYSVWNWRGSRWTSVSTRRWSRWIGISAWRWSGRAAIRAGRRPS